MDEKRLIGLRIERLRKSRGLSRESFAEAADISVNYLGRIERGTENPTLDMFLKIAKALKVETWELLDCKHEANHRELKELLTELVKEADTERLRLAVKILRTIVR
ncbi:MAG: helix-turn-helix transcriptional regulator [Deltaproteobacteria bacterium]|nr:helix-turn-helix transcriptional regulator [Deltaproteobacteria bacterium]